eukprot:scaffold886_cov317-Prasinococcus_capsulatus_cf.AAC.10
MLGGYSSVDKLCALLGIAQAELAHAFGGRSNPESFTPFCFPSQNAGAFLYIYVSFLIKDVALVLVTTQGDSFFDLSQCKKELEENLRMVPPGLRRV